MNLDKIVVQSGSDKQKMSDWISTALGYEGEIICKKYIGEEVSEGQFGKQLKITVFATGKEMYLARPYPLSEESERFIKEIVQVTGNKNDVPFIIGKKTPEPNKPVYYAKEAPEGLKPLAEEAPNPKPNDGDPGPQAE